MPIFRIEAIRYASVAALLPKEALIKLARAGRRGFFRHKEARNRRNTVCISRLSSEFVAEKDRRLPKTHLISGSLDPEPEANPRQFGILDHTFFN